MRKIIIGVNKKLIVSNAVVCAPGDKEGTEEAIYFFSNRLKTNGISIRGPAIVKFGLKRNEPDFSITREVFFQSTYKPGDKLPSNCESKGDMKIGPCMYARVSGEGDNSRYAYEKISVHAYENEIELSGESYMVMLEDEENKIVIDIFIPIKEGTQ